MIREVKRELFNKDVNNFVFDNYFEWIILAVIITGITLLLSIVVINENFYWRYVVGMILSFIGSIIILLTAN